MRAMSLDDLRTLFLNSLMLLTASICLAFPVSSARAQTETHVADLFSIFEPSNEKEIGAQQHKKIVAQYGGEYKHDGLNEYVLDIVLRIVTVTEKRNELGRSRY
ncbi:hypothetical protein [Sneathiella glossodoripedis]|uniref:hypothetical protein n=1 Tax=Sneathiella glossodoripedis TaxID=418853 RepID=UPI0004720FC7|nr:hypothetical protein [Sneathiella glossodoripedis]